MMPRKLFFVLPALQGGGAERVVLSLIAQAMRDPPWQVVLVLTTRQGGALDGDLPEGLRVVRLDAARGRGAAWALLRLIWRERPAIVFATLDHLNIMLGLLRPVMPRAMRLVLRLTRLQTRETAAWRMILPLAFRQAQAVVFQSLAMRQVMGPVLKLGPHVRQSVIVNPLDSARLHRQAALPLPADAPDVFHDRQGRRVIVAAGRLVREKGFDLLIDAVADLADPAIHLVILGAGPEQAALEAQIASRGLSSQVSLAGFQANPWAFIARADLFVLSSRIEGFPNVVIEALACGCPVIATPLAGLDGLAGCKLAAEISAPALTDALRAFRVAPHRADENLVAATHDPRRIWQEYSDLFKSLLT